MPPRVCFFCKEKIFDTAWISADNTYCSGECVAVRKALVARKKRRALRLKKRKKKSHD